MIKDNLKELAYPSEVEKKIKYFLAKKLDHCSFEDTYYYLVFRNQIFQTAYNINDEEIKKILLKNYILSQNSTNPKINILELSYQEKMIFKRFNQSIEDNDLYTTFDLLRNYFNIFEQLCLSYIKNINESNNSIIEQIPANRLKQVYNKIFLLKQMDINNKTKKLTK